MHYSTKGSQPPKTIDEECVRLGAGQEHLRVPLETHEERLVESHLPQFGKFLRPAVQHGRMHTHALTPLDNRSVHFARQFSTRTIVYNYTDRPIYSVDRSGLPIHLLPDVRRSGLDARAVVIRKEYCFDDEASCLRTYQTLVTMGAISCSELIELGDLLKVNVGYARYGRKLYTEYAIAQAELEENDHGVYHYKCDIAVGLVGNELPMHPCSPQRVDSFPSEFYSDGHVSNDLIFRVRYISHRPDAKPKYIRVGNQVFQLSPELIQTSKLTTVVDKSGKHQVELSEYIEFLRSYQSARNQTSSIRCQRVSLEEAEKNYGVFDTEAEATSPVETHENRIKAIEENSKVDKNKSSMKIDELRLELLQSKQQYTQLKAENAFAAEKLKEDHEKDSHARKMSSEQFKFTAAVVTSLLGIVPLVIKFRQSTGKT